MHRLRSHILLLVVLTGCAGEGEPAAGDEADTSVADGADATSDGDDARVPGPDARAPGPDARAPGTDGATPAPDGATSAPDARVLPTDGAVAPPPDAAPAPSLPPAAARPPAPPPDGSDVVNALAGERPDLLAGSCVEMGGNNEFLFEVVRRLRARDVRWGLVARGGALLQDRVGYYWGDGPAEGGAETYVIDVIGRHCARPGVDEPAVPGWLDDSAAGGQWTLRPLTGDPLPPPADAGPGPGPGPGPMLPLPDERGTVDGLAAERPDLLAASCVEHGGHNEFLFELVRRLRARDPRWGLNWKRGNVGDMSQDVVDYFWADGEPEGRTEVYIIDVIGGHCGDNPSPAFTDVTEATRQGGTIGRWTLQPLPR